MNTTDTKYEINNLENHLPFIADTTEIFTVKYFIIMNNYVNLYFENIYDNVSISTDKRYRYYIFVKGQEVLANIIKLLTIYTNNIDLVLFHTHKAYYYYIEFISQLESDNNQLELNVKDAIVFVYKKTIFELKSSIAICNPDSNNNNKEHVESCENALKIDNIEKTIELVNIFINIFILKDLLNNSVVYSNSISNSNSNSNSNINYVNPDSSYHNKNPDDGSSKYINQTNSLNIWMNAIFKNITKLSKYYVNESEYNKLLGDYLTVMRPIMCEFNKINIINNETYNINQTVDFDLLLQLLEKILMKIAGLQNMDYVVNTKHIGCMDFIYDLNIAKIRDIVNNVMIIM